MTANAAQGSGTGATGATPSPTQTLTSRPNSFSLWLLKCMAKSKREETLGKFSPAFLFVGFAIAAPITLVGLPLGALWVAHEFGCCTTNSIEQLISFWGSVLGGMLALFGMLITAVFVISAFRIDKSAKAEAGVAAAEYAGKFFVEYKCEVMRKIDEEMDKATKSIDAASTDTQTAKDAAIVDINAAKSAAESTSRDAISAIVEVRENVAGKGKEATEAIDQAARDFDGRKVAAIEQIDAQVAEVERAAAEAKARIQAQPDDSPPGDSRD